MTITYTVGKLEKKVNLLKWDPLMTTRENAYSLGISNSYAYNLKKIYKLESNTKFRNKFSKKPSSWLNILEDTLINNRMASEMNAVFAFDEVNVLI